MIFMKKITRLSLFLMFMLLFWGCKDNSTSSEGSLTSANSQKNFVWNAMNYWYYWQADVPELADDMAYFDGQQDFQDYLIAYNDAEALYDDLIYEEEDDFSFFIDNYEEFQEARLGRSQNFGFEFGLVRFCGDCSEIFGYVQYVLDDTPADNAGLTRGDIFTEINGTELTVNNYQSLLSNSSYELTMAESIDGEIGENGETVTVSETEISENPIYLSKVIDAGAAKVGYLMYNSFQTNSHENLNNVFRNFNSEGIDELVLDLRYNGGGAVVTSRTLCSLISGLGDSDEFGTYSFNSKRAPQYNATINFYTEIPVYDESGNRSGEISKNAVSIDRLFVLTDYKTASASESVINALRAYMEVIVIGTQTVGKDDISLTLFDSGESTEFLDDGNANPSHKMAIQPIIGKLVNADDLSENDGFIPDFIVSERQFLNDLPPLGDENEPLLAKALEQITGAPPAKSLQTVPEIQDQIFRTNLSKPEDGMYILPDETEEFGLISRSSTEK